MASLFELEQMKGILASQQRMKERRRPEIRLRQAAMIAKHYPDHPACRLLQQKSTENVVTESCSTEPSPAESSS